MSQPLGNNLAGSRRRTNPEPDREVKRRPNTRFAFEPDATPHQVDKTPADREAKPRAAVLPRDERSVIIRSFFGGGFGGSSHPLRRDPHYSTQLVQTLDDFARREKEGWASYWDLVTLGNR